MTKRLVAVSVIALLLIGVLVPLTVSSASYQSAPQISTLARVRVAVVTQMGNVDVYVDNVASGVSAINLPNVSGYVNVAAGSHSISLMQSGTTTPVGSPYTASFVAGTYYTLVLLPDMTWQSITDANPVPATGMAEAKLVNLSPNTDPVSVAVDGTVPTEFTSVAYKTATSSYVSLTAGTHVLTIPGSNAQTKSYNFQANHDYTIFVFYNPTKGAPVIIPKTDTIFNVGGTLTPAPTGSVTGTPGPTPTVGVPLNLHLYLPITMR